MHLLMASCDKLILGETIEVTGESLCLGTVTTASARCSVRFAIPHLDEKASLAQGHTACVYNAIILTAVTLVSRVVLIKK